jgi:hypothetical protein
MRDPSKLLALDSEAKPPPTKSPSPTIPVAARQAKASFPIVAKQYPKTTAPSPEQPVTVAVVPPGSNPSEVIEAEYPLTAQTAHATASKVRVFIALILQEQGKI